MGSCNHDQPLTPEMDAAVARVALGEGDLSHAAHHVAGALASDPHRPDLLALLDLLVSAAGGSAAALDLFPIAGGTWFGAAAIHARLLAEADPTGALDLICQVAAARPDVPYLPWAGAWLDRVDPGEAGTSFSRLLAIDAEPGTAEVLHSLVPALDLLRSLRERSPEAAGLWAISSMLTRRAGRPDEALELARTAFQRFPSWNSAVALANACKVVERWSEAEEAWTSALTFDPDDLSVRLDWADTRLDRGELAGARAKYQEVLDRQPDHPWAIPSAAFVDWRTQPTVDGRLALARYADRHLDNRRARWAADRATPWLGYLPPPQEATIDALHRSGESSELRMTLSHLESASSQVAARDWVEGRGGSLSLAVELVPTPDPRCSSGAPRWTPWRWSGTTASPALEGPTDPVAGTVLAKLASSRYHSAQWLGYGAQIARQHGLGDVLSEAVAEDLLRAALHPPAGPSWCSAWDWRYRITHALAFVVAGYPGWADSVQRDVLWSMFAVRSDWFAVAAAAAAAERGQADDARDDLRDRLLEVVRDRPDRGYWCVGWPATNALVRIGTDDDELREVLLAGLRSWEEPAADA